MKRLLLILFPCVAFAQSPVITAFPSLRIPSSSRGLAMGDNGIASATENQTLYYNAAKSAFTQNFHQVSVNYTPWLAAISPDTRFINLNYLSNVFNTSAFGISLNYLNLGLMQSRDNNGATIAEYKAREFSVGTSYALQLNNNASLAVALRFLGQNAFAKNIYSFCGDVTYYQYLNLGDQNQKIEWGATISNVGPKVGDAKNSLPTNLGLGFGYSAADEEGSQFTASLDLNKLLVPGIFSSFKEPDQLQLIRCSVGLEYGYLNEFFLRGGVSLEDQNKGNRKYFGLGVGYKGMVMDQSWGIDVHYLVPFGTVAAVSPFQNAFGFSLKLSFGNFQ